MDLSNLVQSPLDPEQDQAPQQKPYWQVLKEHQDLLAANPDLAGTSVPEFAQAMGPGYEAGLGPDTALRRASGNIDIALHGFGGGAPGYKGPTLAETLGGPREGWDLPKLVGGGVRTAAERVGAGPELAGKLEQVGAGFPRMAVDIGAGAALGGIPTIAGLSALSTYGETGRKLPAAISGLSALLIPKAAEEVGGAFMRAAGAKTLAETSPDLLNKATGLLPADTVAQMGRQLDPTILQKLAGVGGAQVGMFGVGEATEAAQNLAGEGTTQQKIGRIAEQFSPSSLVATGFAQLPWTVYDLARTRPTDVSARDQATLKNLKQDFAKRYVQASLDVGRVPTPGEVSRVIDRQVSGKPPETPEQAQLLASIGQAPIEMDLKRPVGTATGDWPMTDAIEGVKARANGIVTARPDLGIEQIGAADDNRIYSALRTEEIASGGKLSRDELARRAAHRVIDTMTHDSADLGDISPEYRTLNEDEARRQQQDLRDYSKDVEISNRVDPTLDVVDPNTGERVYDPALHQKIALLTGNKTERQDLGLYPRTELGADQPQPITLSARDKTDPTKVFQVQDNLLSQIERDMSRGVDPVTGLPRPKVLTADATFAARRAAEEYSQPVDLNDPESVRAFYEYVKSAVQRAQLGFGRQRPEEFHLRDETGKVKEYPDQQSAELEISHLNETKPKEVEYTFRKRGTHYEVVKLTYPRTISATPTEVGGPEKVRLATEGAPEVGPTEEEVNSGIESKTLSQFGEALAQAEKNQMLEQFRAQNQIRDPAVREARKVAIAQNAIDFVKAMPDSKIQELLSQGPVGKETPSLTTAARRKALFVKMMQFLRDGGDLSFETKRTEAGRQVHLTTTDLNEAQQKADATPGANIKAEPFEGRLIKFTPVGGGEPVLQHEAPTTKYTVYTKTASGGLSVKGVGDLEALNRYLGNVGFKNVTSLERSTMKGLNVFEQFHILSKYLATQFINPSKVVDFIERPRGDFGWFQRRPEGAGPDPFFDNIEKNVLVRWPREYKAPIVMRPSEFGKAPETAVSMQDRNGKELRFEGDYPLATLFIQAAKHQATVSARELFDLYRQFAPNSDKELMDILGALTLHPFGGNIRVGFGLAKDPITKGYYHYGDDFLTGTGILLSPYSETASPRFLRELDRPENVLPHLVHELAHAHTVFAYRYDPAVKSEVDQVWKQISEHHKAQLGLGVEGKFSVDSISHAVSRPEEVLANFFNNGLFREYLKTIPDYAPKGGRVQTFGSVFDRIMDVVRKVFARLVGDSGANTMLQRVSDVTQLAMRAQENIRQQYGIRHEGDIFTALERRGAATGEDLIYGLKPQPPTPVAGAPQVFPMDNRAVARAQLKEAQSRRQVAETSLNAFRGQADQYGPEEAKQHLQRLEADLADARVAEQTAQGLVDKLTMGQFLPSRELNEATSKARERYLNEYHVEPSTEKPGTFYWFAEGQSGRAPTEESARAAARTVLEENLRREGRPPDYMVQSELAKSGQLLMSKAIMNVAGRKDTLLRDDRVTNILRNFATGGQRVTDAFSGSGQLTAALADFGAKTTLNVRSPQFLKIFEEVKNNPEDFGRRVAAAVEPIKAPRDAAPSMKDGSSLVDYLNKLEQTDPPVGLLLKQNLSARGREVTPGRFYPAISTTEAGLRDLPNRISEFGGKVDTLISRDGWDIVGKAKRGDRVVIDPPYANVEGMYGGERRKISTDERLNDYNQKLFPAVKKGAEFVVFDAADPRLINALKSNGFTVDVVSRTPRAGGAVKPELVATNMKGQFLESRAVPKQPLLDSMKAASEYVTEDENGQWFKPLEFNHFRRSFGPIFGDRLAPERHGDQWGFRVGPDAYDGVTADDLALAPKPKETTWAPSAFETMKSLFVKNGETEADAEALAGYNMVMASLLKGTERGVWGTLVEPPQKLPSGTYLATHGVAAPRAMVAALNPELATRETVPATTRHEQTHLAGFSNENMYLPSDVRDAVRSVNSIFRNMSQDERDTVIDGLVNLSNQTRVAGVEKVYPLSRTDPNEFASEFMAHVGQGLGNVPSPNAYVRDVMRFTPDELSNLLMKTTLRRAQALDGLRRNVADLSAERGISSSKMLDTVDKLAEAFKGMGREALDIALDQADFYKMRNLYPDMYKELVKTTQSIMTNVNAPGYLLQSREPPIYKRALEAFGFPPDPREPTKPSWWNRNVAQITQFADDHPVARPFVDMMFAARGLHNIRLVQLDTALAGAFESGKLISDTRTKQVLKLATTQSLRDTLSKIALDVNLEGDKTFDANFKAANGDLSRMGEVDIMTPEYMDAIYRKYGVSAADRGVIDTVLDGMRKQIKMTAATMVDSQMVGMETVAAKAVARATNLAPEPAREVAKLITKSVRAMDAGDQQTALAAQNEFVARVPDLAVAEGLFDMVNDGWQRTKRLERFLSIRMPYYFSERRSGNYGLWWRDETGKLQSNYFATGDQRSAFIKRENVEPIRQTNPGDTNYGVPDEIFTQLNDIQAKMTEKLKDLFGEKDAEEMATVMDMATELRNVLSAKDVLRTTTQRKLAKSRGYLDMFDTHLNYVNSVATAARNKQMRLEADLLLDTPEFANQPLIKNLLKQYLDSTIKPDTPLGTFVSMVNFVYFMGLNLSSMILEPFQQLSALAPMLTRAGATVKDGYGHLAWANKQVIESKTRGGRYKDPELQSLMERARQENVVDQGIIAEMDHNTDMQIINRIRAVGGLSLYTPFEMFKNRVYQAANLTRKFYGLVPAYNSEAAFAAAYRMLKGQGYTGEDLYREISHMVRLTMLGGGKFNRPIGLFANVPRSAAQAMWSLQSYSSSMMSMMGRLIKDATFNPKGLTPAQTAQTRKAAVQMLGTQFVFAGALGMPFVQLGIIALQKLFPQENIEKLVRDFFNQFNGDDDATGGFIGSALATGVPSALSNAPDMGSRFALSNVLGVSPYSDLSLSNVIGPTSSVIKNVFNAVQAGVRGDPMKTAEDIMPRGILRIWKTLEQGNSFMSPTGRTLVDDLSPVERFGRIVGFTPARVARVQDAQRLERMSEDASKEEERQFIDKTAKMVMAGDQDQQAHQAITQEALESKGTRRPEDLTRSVAKRVIDMTMPVDLRDFGNKHTAELYRSMKGVLGTQTQAPSNAQRIAMQQQIAARLGFYKAMPSRSTIGRSMQLDRLLELYPNLSRPQAAILLNRATSASPIAQELIGGGE